MSNENMPAGAVDPEQFKKIAAVTITNSSIIAALAALQATMISKMVPLLSDDPEVDGLLDSAQELSRYNGRSAIKSGGRTKGIGLNLIPKRASSSIQRRAASFRENWLMTCYYYPGMTTLRTILALCAAALLSGCGDFVHGKATADQSVVHFFTISTFHETRCR